MAFEIPTFLVRHGEYDRRSGGHLTARGHEQITNTLRQLRSMELGKWFVLSSTEIRAIESAAILGDGLPAPVRESQDLAKFGQYPMLLKEDFGQFLQELVTTSHTQIDEVEALAVVTHEPMIRAAIAPPADGGRLHVPLGSAVQYEGYWRPNF